MGRKRNTEIIFGSDSFLDIVANIVGILIILIVIAGVRVSQMPAVSVPSESPGSALVAATSVPLIPPEQPRLLEVRRTLPIPPPPDVPVQTPPPPGPPPELVSRVRQAEEELARLGETEEALSARLLATVDNTQSIRQQVAESQAALQTQRGLAEKGRQVIADLQTDIETKQRTIAGLHLELAETEAAAPPPQILRHKLTPLGREVNGEELHFLLSKGRVAVVPVAELAEELQAELQRKRNQLIRGQTRVGKVGPIKGFIMEYVVARQAISLIDELRMGTAVIKVGVSEWRMLPEPTVVTESLQQALHPTSRFLGALRAGGRDATLTFWVYPDSFSLHRQLQQFAHDNGFDVAGRPLPFGIPITGSNQGSRSVAQ